MSRDFATSFSPGAGSSFHMFLHGGWLSRPIVVLATLMNFLCINLRFSTEWPARRALWRSWTPLSTIDSTCCSGCENSESDAVTMTPLSTACQDTVTATCMCMHKGDNQWGERSDVDSEASHHAAYMFSTLTTHWYERKIDGQLLWVSRINEISTDSIRWLHKRETLSNGPSSFRTCVLSWTTCSSASLALFWEPDETRAQHIVHVHVGHTIHLAQGAEAEARLFWPLLLSVRVFFPLSLFFSPFILFYII